VTERKSATDHSGDGQAGTIDERRIWTFDPEAGAVADSNLALMPQGKRWASVALVTVDGQQYVHAIAGRFGGSGPTNTNCRYDIDEQEWIEMSKAPLKGNYGTNSNPVIDNTVYLTHGITLDGELSMRIYQRISHRYNPVTDTFTTDTLSPTYPRTGPVDGVIDGTLYVAGGHMKRYDQNNQHEVIPVNEAFTPPRNQSE
jgi:hypothetical protein